MNYWLLKSEPSTWSWHQQCQVTSEPWTGVRNYQARNFLKAMRRGDLAFFYHSVTDKKIMGIVEVVKEFYPDPTDETHIPNWFKELPFNDAAMETGIVDQKVENLLGVLDWKISENTQISSTFDTLFSFE